MSLVIIKRALQEQKRCKKEITRTFLTLWHGFCKKLYVKLLYNKGQRV